MGVAPLLAEGELGHHQLADDDRAGALQPLDDGAVGGGDAVPFDLRAGGRADAGGVVEVFNTDGDAVHRSAVLTARHLRLGLLGGQHRLVAGDGDEGVDRGLDLVDALEKSRRDLDGRDLPRTQQRAQLGNRTMAEVVGAHDGVPGRNTSAGSSSSSSTARSLCSTPRRVTTLG